MAANAGKVWMTFDDGTAGFVPVRNVEQAKKDGGKVASFARSSFERARESAMETARKAPMVASLAATGGLAGPAISRLPAAARALAGVTGMGTAMGAGQAVTEGASRALGYGDAPGSIGEASKTGAVTGAFGETLAPMVSAAGVPLMMAAQSSRLGLPLKEIAGRARAALTERIPVGANPLRPGQIPGSERGAALRATRDQAAQQAAKDISKYGPQVGPGVRSGQPMTFRMNRVLPALRSIQSMANRIPGYGASAKKINGIIQDTMKKYGNRDLGMDEVRQLRKDMDALGEAIQTARSAGKNEKSLTPLKRAHKAIADDLRSVLRDPALGSELPAAEKSLQNAILAEKGARAGEKGLPMAANFAIPAMAASATQALHPGPMAGEVPQMLLAGGAARLLAEPWVTSRLALGAQNPLLQMLLRRGPSLASSAMPPSENK
jgi:hypothetical protein